jgi:hypothetical protein
MRWRVVPDSSPARNGTAAKLIGGSARLKAQATKRVNPAPNPTVER